MAGKPWTEEMKAAAKAKREAAAAGKPKPAPKTSAPRRRPAKDPVVEAVETMLGVLSLPLMAIGSRNESFLADALALELSAEPLGQAMAEVAKVNPALGDWLEKGAPATPYILLGTVLFSLGTQIAVNHGASLGPLAGTANPRSVMIAEKRRRIAEMQMQQEAAERQQETYDAEDRAQAEALAKRNRIQAQEDATEPERSDAEYLRRLSEDPAPSDVLI